MAKLRSNPKPNPNSNPNPKILAFIQYARARSSRDQRPSHLRRMRCDVTRPPRARGDVTSCDVFGVRVCIHMHFDGSRGAPAARAAAASGCAWAWAGGGGGGGRGQGARGGRAGRGERLNPPRSPAQRAPARPARRGSLSLACSRPLRVFPAPAWQQLRWQLRRQLSVAAGAFSTKEGGRGAATSGGGRALARCDDGR